MTFSQKFELGKVSDKELSEKRHPTDTAAVAAVLYNKVKTTFKYTEKNGFSAIHEFEIRIKFYKKEGLQYANYEVPYRIKYENLNSDILSFSDVVTYNLVNGKVEKTKLSGDGTFKEKVNENWKTTTITLPNVKEGSVIEFKYTLKSENILMFPTVEFQKEIPVNFAEYRTEIPAYYFYKPVLKGFLNITTKSEIENAFQNYTSSNAMRTESFSYRQITSVHSAKDIPALKEEVFVDNIDNYRSAIDYELEVIKGEGVPDKNLSKTWEGVAKTIFEDEDFGKQLKMREYFEPELNAIIIGIESKEERAKAILSYVKAKIKWNGTYGIYTDVGVKKAFLDRTGNVAEVNFILISMLNSAGIISSPVLVSTVRNGVAVYPNQTAFNYVVAATEINGKRLLLDATNEYSYFNILPSKTLNWKGRLINIDGSSEEIDMVPSVNSKNTINIVASIAADGKVSGKVRIQKTDYVAFDFREDFLTMNTESYLERLENNFGGLQINNYQLENGSNLELPVLQTFDFTSNNEAEIIGDKMYISPMLFFATSKNPFVQDERKLPLFFGYPKENKMTFSIEIPAGYTIETIPQPINISTGEGVASFKYNIQPFTNKVQVVVTSEVNQMLVSQDFYPIVKEFFQKSVDKQNEKIVLKKT